MNETLLLEIGTEEIPSRFIPKALESIRSIAEEKLRDSRIPFRDINTWGTPRRLALMVRGVPTTQEDLVTEYKGPKWTQAFDANGNPTNAAMGFAKSKNVNFEDLESREIKGVKYAFVKKSEKGRPVTDILPELLPEIIQSIPFAKRMYWKDSSFRFARPVRWIVSLLGENIIPITVGGIESGRITRGHRFMGTRSIEIKDASEYLDRLFDNYVIADQHKRREKMLSGISAIENELSGNADKLEGLVQENLYLVEFPVPFYGKFDSAFLELPEEVLTTTMIHHQKYLPVRDENGKLMDSFIGISNNRAANMDTIREGNERVLRARLSDAAFFWREDTKRSLSSRVSDLKNVVYQEKLGSLYDKVIHTRNIAEWLCREAGEEDLLDTVLKAGYIAKSDLVTSMVYEFPELQGVIGREYALKDGESIQVAKALEEQYLPRFAGDRLPSELPGALLGIAERTFNIISCFKAGLQVTGSQDPYGLRRSARTINEIIWALDLDLDLEKLFDFSIQEIGTDVDAATSAKVFFDQRLFMQVKEKGFSHEIVRMSMALVASRPLQLLRLVKTLEEVINEEWFSELVTSAVRVRNILSGTDEDFGDVDVTLLEDGPEKDLYNAVREIEPEVRDAVERFDWKKLEVQLSELSPYITTFFDRVLVMDDDPSIRSNRLALLSLCHKLFTETGDLGSLNM